MIHMGFIDEVTYILLIVTIANVRHKDHVKWNENWLIAQTKDMHTKINCQNKQKEWGHLQT
jgi:hypothetical protein